MKVGTYTAKRETQNSKLKTRNSAAVPAAVADFSTETKRRLADISEMIFLEW